MSNCDVQYVRYICSPSLRIFGDAVYVRSIMSNITREGLLTSRSRHIRNMFSRQGNNIRYYVTRKPAAPAHEDRLVHLRRPGARERRLQLLALTQP